MEKTLVRRSNKLREGAILSAAPGKNGDRFWERDFDFVESIAFCREHESGGGEHAVWCGLELWRAREHADYGEWEEYLWRIRISKATASRRKQKARQFLEWAKLIPPNQFKISEQDAINGMDLIHRKCFTLKHFLNYLRDSLDPGEVYNHKTPCDRMLASAHRGAAKFGEMWRLSLKSATKRIEEAIGKVDRDISIVTKLVTKGNALFWKTAESIEGEEKLEIWANRLRQQAEELDQLREKIAQLKKWALKKEARNEKNNTNFSDVEQG